MNSKSQVWFMDFAIALLLFTFTLAVYFSYTNNFQKQDKGDLDVMLSDAKSISSSLALSGYPSNWDNITVIRIGIADEQKVNTAKFKTLKKLDYKASKKKFATQYDYFIFFLNDRGEVLNIKGACGAGYALINPTFKLKSAYYYGDEDDKFLKGFMNESFGADIYFGDNPSDLGDIDSLVSNLSKYQLLVMEHPALTAANFNQNKDKFENYSSRGGLTMLSGELSSSQGKALAGAEFYKKSGTSISDRNATINNTDQYIALNVGESMVFAQAFYVVNISAEGFVQIATFNADQKNAISRWKYGNGTIYFFSDFDVSFFNGNFVGVVEDTAEGAIEGTCNPINLTNITPKKFVKTERYLNYNSKIVKMVVYLWG